MFSVRVNPMGWWAPGFSDLFLNKTGSTLTRGQVVQVNIQAATLANGWGLEEVIAVTGEGAGVFVVCLNEAVPDGEMGWFGITGLFDVLVAAGVGGIASLSNGDTIAPTTSQRYASKERDQTAAIGKALADGPTTASPDLRKCLFNGFCPGGGAGAHNVRVINNATYSVPISESGFTYSVSNGTISLPLATPGLRYTFVKGVGAFNLTHAGSAIGDPWGVDGLVPVSNGWTISLECVVEGTWNVMKILGDPSTATAPTTFVELTPADSGNWEVPAHTGAVFIECFGAGGDGGTGRANDSTSSGGGGGGEYASKTATLALSSYVVAIPSGNSTDRTFFTPTDEAGAICLANPGTAGDSNAAMGAGGSGGVGDTVTSGLPGGDYGGGDGNDGGACPHGGDGGTGHASDGTSGDDGAAPGGGGGGSGLDFPDLVNDIPGGAGADGMIRITYTPA